MNTVQLPAPRAIRLETANYTVRTVERADATERWGQWLLDPVVQRQLNATPEVRSIEQLHGYIDRFDRVKSHLLGIFEKDTGRLVGIRSIYVDHTYQEFLDNILIGEPDARGKTARSESTDAVLPYFFDELGMQASRCAILAENTHMIELVARKGWVHEHTDFKAAASDGRGLELRHFRLSRETWRQKMRERSVGAGPRTR